MSLRSILALALLTMIPALCLAQYDPNLVPAVQDTRSIGLGRTALMSPVGGAAVFTNPALLPLGQGLSVSSGFLNNQGRIGHTRSDVDLNESADANILAQVYLAPSAVSWAGKLPGSNLSYGLAIGYGSLFCFDREAESVKGFHSGQQYQSSSSFEGNMNAVSLGAGLAVGDMLSFGLSYHRGPEQQLRYYEDLEILDALSGEVTNTRMEASIRAAVSRLNLSLRAAPFHWLEASFFLAPAYELSMPEILMAYYENGEELGDPFDGSGDDISLPMELGLGLAYRSSEDWTFIGEYRPRNFSGMSFGDAESEIGNGHCIRLGMEARKLFDVRFGIFRESVLPPAIPNHINTHTEPALLVGGALGLGKQIGPVALDLALELSRYSYTVHIDELNMDWTEKLSEWNIYTSLAYTF